MNESVRDAGATGVLLSIGLRVFSVDEFLWPMRTKFASSVPLLNFRVAQCSNIDKSNTV